MYKFTFGVKYNPEADDNHEKSSTNCATDFPLLIQISYYENGYFNCKLGKTIVSLYYFNNVSFRIWR